MTAKFMNRKELKNYILNKTPFHVSQYGTRTRHKFYLSVEASVTWKDEDHYYRTHAHVPVSKRYLLRQIKEGVHGIFRMAVKAGAKIKVDTRGNLTFIG